MKDLQALIAHIKDSVSLGEIMRARGVIRTTLSEEQFSCPFHGADQKKSARYYSETDSAYCWVCKERWDLFSYISRAESLSFSQALDYFIKNYRIDISRVPEATSEGTVMRTRERTAVRYSDRKLHTEKILMAIQTVRDEIPVEKYTRMAFAFMLLKHTTSDEKFEESAQKLKDGILRVIKEKQCLATS